MPGFCGHYPAVKRASREKKVAYQIQDLMPYEFVFVAEFVIDNYSVLHDESVIVGSAFTKPFLAEGFFVYLGQMESRYTGRIRCDGVYALPLPGKMTLQWGLIRYSISVVI